MLLNKYYRLLNCIAYVLNALITLDDTIYCFHYTLCREETNLLPHISLYLHNGDDFYDDSEVYNYNIECFHIYRDYFLVLRSSTNQSDLISGRNV